MDATFSTFFKKMKKCFDTRILNPDESIDRKCIYFLTYTDMTFDEDEINKKEHEKAIFKSPRYFIHTVWKQFFF